MRVSSHLSLNALHPCSHLFPGKQLTRLTKLGDHLSSICDVGLDRHTVASECPLLAFFQSLFQHLGVQTQLHLGFYLVKAGPGTKLVVGCLWCSEKGTFVDRSIIIVVCLRGSQCFLSFTDCQ